MIQQHTTYTKMFLNYDNTNLFYSRIIYEPPGIYGNYNITISVLKQIKKTQKKGKPAKKKQRKSYNIGRSSSPGISCCVFVLFMYRKILLFLRKYSHHVFFKYIIMMHFQDTSFLSFLS